MKQFIYLFFVALFVFSSCTKDKCERTITYETQVPIYQSWEELRVPVVAGAPQILENMGKIYFKNSYIFINEINEGIHVVNNATPTNPQKIAFIPIPGNKDMAIKGDLLYADSYTDLVVLNVANPENATEVGRMEGLYPDHSWFMGLNTDPELGVVVDYKTEIVTEVVDCNNGGYWYAEDDVFVSFDLQNSTAGDFNGGGITATGTGMGGSFARFTIKNDKLYAVSDAELHTVDISNGENPVVENNTQVGWNIETIFPYENSLFMGSQAGMFIYDVSNGSSPQYLSEFEHARACDPVVVNNDIAYVTLRDGNECAGFQNQLDIIDVENLEEPFLIATEQLFHPMGLGVASGILFVCDDTEGLKIFDCSEPDNLRLIGHHPEFQAYDVIPVSGMLIMIGSDGLYLYNYKNADEITLLGAIEKGN